MKKSFVQLLVTVLVLSTLFGCGGPQAAAPTANSHPTLPAFPAPCQTSPAEQIIRLTPQIPATGPGGEMLGSQAFLPSILAAATPSAFCPAIQRGLVFLTARYNPTLGLLNEAPIVKPHRYWLTNDNALAAYAFAQLGQAKMSATLKESILGYGSGTNGLIEVVWGVPVAFPPFLILPIRGRAPERTAPFFLLALKGDT